MRYLAINKPMRGELRRNILIIKISLKANPYSLRKRKTKSTLPSSMLNPLISSLSPSSRSKGARFLSIKHSKAHLTNHTKISSTLRERVLVRVISFVKLAVMSIMASKVTSKDRLWSMARMPPTFENPLLPPHPIKIIE